MHYLKELGLSNIGPVQEFKLTAEFNDDDTPKPIVLIGKNGSGKTIAISTIVDALHEFACVAGFTDVLPMQGAGGHAYWRVSGGSITSQTQARSVSWLKMNMPEVEAENLWTYADRSGEFSIDDWNEIVGTSIPYSGTGDVVKALTPSNPTDFAKELFLKSVFCYFPSNRHETPFWANKSYESEKSGDGTHRFSAQLGKQVECIQSMRENAAWLMDALLDDYATGNDLSRRSQFVTEWHKNVNQKGGYTNAELLALTNYIVGTTLQILTNANEILSKILSSKARFGVGNRKHNKRLHFIHLEQEDRVLHVSHLSNGQSSLLNIFLTILRHADDGSANKPLDQIEGVVVIDEADAGLHINYQHDVLPKLMKLMPKVQFILTTHSPLLLLGKRIW